MTSPHVPDEWEILSAYLDGQLSSREMDNVRQKLQAQPDLQRALDELQRTRMVLKAAPRRRAPRNFTLSPSMVPQRRRFFAWTTPVFGFASVLAAVLLVLDSDGPGAGVANLWTGLILLLAAVLIVRRVLSRPEVTLQSIYGAISAYLVLGLMFAAFYAAMYRFGGNTFFNQGKHVGDTRIFQYFSFITLTTTGYGDYTAAGSGGQAVAVLEAITGVVFLATLVARLVAGFRGAGAGGRGSSGGSGGGSGGGPAPPGPAGARRAGTRRSGGSGLVGHRPGP